MFRNMNITSQSDLEKGGHRKGVVERLGIVSLLTISWNIHIQNAMSGKIITSEINGAMLCPLWRVL